MSLPKPEAGLVIRYSYLWHDEFSEGREEGTKDRPCAIVLAAKDDVSSRERVWVLPVTHSKPASAEAAIEIPAAIKARLGLDGDRSWVVLSEWNEFLWPSPNLRRVGDRNDSSVAYGFLPPRFGNHVRERFAQFVRERKAQRVARTE